MVAPTQDGTELMCGVFATTRPDLWRDRTAEVLERLHHRGPDAHGIWESPTGDVLFAHTRLSILGLGTEGNQPAVLPTGEAITFNGEIYNFRDIAKGLGPEAALSDTQAVIQSLSRNGLSATDQFRGMYSFVYWDPSLRSLSAARDPWGIKPLYALDHPTGGVTLSSEIGPLLLHSDGREVDPLGVAQYIAFGHTLPQVTCYARIRKLEPGTVYSWSLHRDEPLTLSTRKVEQIEPEGPVPVQQAIEDSVHAHLVADVEVGVFLSGGIDSTLLTAIASEKIPSLHAFTLAFPDAPAMDEGAMAAANAASMGLRHTLVPVTAADMLGALDTLLLSTGEPFGDAAGLPLIVLSQRAACDLKVVLTGEGADELFGGYGRYRISRFLPRSQVPGLGQASARLADIVYDRRSDRPRSRAIESLLRLGGGRSHAALLGSDLPAVAVANDVGPMIDALLRSDWEAFTNRSRGREAARRFDLARWLPNTYLEKTDRATMAAGLEARTPYLDPVVAAAAHSPGRSFGKADLRAALLARWPDTQLPDRKKGLAVPIAQLLSSSLGEDLSRTIHSADSLIYKCLSRDAAVHLGERAKRSPSTAYRLAVLGRWEATGTLDA